VDRHAGAVDARAGRRAGCRLAGMVRAQSPALGAPCAGRAAARARGHPRGPARRGGSRDAGHRAGRRLWPIADRAGRRPPALPAQLPGDGRHVRRRLGVPGRDRQGRDRPRALTAAGGQVRRELLRLLRRTDAVQHRQRAAVDVGQLRRRCQHGRDHEPLGPGGRDSRRSALPEGQRRPGGLGSRDLRLQPRRLVRRRGQGVGRALPRRRDRHRRRARRLVELAATARWHPLVGAGARHQRDVRPAHRPRRRDADAALPTGAERLLCPQRPPGRWRAPARPGHRPRARPGRQLVVGGPARA
jgi:hypothetical protein